MDFISNLIKRPISLVLNDSGNSHTSDKMQKSTELSSSPPTTQQKQQQPPHQQERRLHTPPINQNIGAGSLFTTAMNTSINAKNVINTDTTTSSTRSSPLPMFSSSSPPPLNASASPPSLPLSSRSPPPLQLSSPSPPPLPLSSRSPPPLPLSSPSPPPLLLPLSSPSPTPPPPPLSSSSLHMSSNSSNVSITSNQAITIEELLIQINDNLNQASLCDELAIADVAAATEQNHVNHHYVNLSSILSPTSSTKTKTSAVNTNTVAATDEELSPLTPTTTKQTAASNKMTTSPSPHSKDITATVLMSPSVVSPAPVATTAALEAVDNNHKENPFLNLINNGADMNNSSTKFSGLPEFDECEIPELSSGLLMNSEMDDPLGLTFEDGLIPTLTAKMNQHLNSTAAKDDSNNSKAPLHQQQLLVVCNETDTAVSSDNETFAECQAYQEEDEHRQLEIGNTINSGDVIQDFSGVESYFSAVNSNMTITNATIDQMATLNTTLENVVENIQSQLSSTAIIATTTTNVDESKPPVDEQLLQLQNLAEPTFDDYEPMDVDMSFSEQDIENILQHVDSTQQRQQHVASAENAEHIKESHSVENTTTAAQSEVLLNKSIELPICSSRAKKTSNDCLVQDNSIDSATDNLTAAALRYVDANIVPVINTEHVATANEIADNAGALAANNDVIILKKPTSSLDVSTKLSNLTLDLTSSFSSAKGSAPASPTFPIKTSLNDVKEFPRSPTAAARQNKEIAYLEKSEYAESQLNCTTKKPETTLSTVVSHNKVTEKQQPMIQPNGAHNLNTIDLCTPEKSISPIPNGDGMLNGLFNNSSSSSNSGAATTHSSVTEFQDNLSANNRLTSGITPPTETDAQSLEQYQIAAAADTTKNLNLPDATKRRTFNVNDVDGNLLGTTTSHDEKRYTFGINLETQSPPIESNEKEKRRTFNVATTTTDQNAHLQESFEAMDVDDTLPAPPSSFAATFPISPPIPTVLKRQIEEDILQKQQLALQPPPVKGESKLIPQLSQSPPIPTLQKGQSEKEMVDVPSEFPSPPIPTLQKRQSEEEIIQTTQSVEEIKQMPPPSQSPPIPTLQKRQSVEEPMQMPPPSQSPPIPTLRKCPSVEELMLMPPPSQSPPVPTLQKRNSEKEMLHMPSEFPSPTLQKEQSEKKEDATAQMPPPSLQSVPRSYIQKRPSIHLGVDRFVKPTAIEKLSAKEQTKCNARDEKDIFIDKTPSPLDEMFMTTTAAAAAGAFNKTSTATSESNAFSGFGIRDGGGDSDSFDDQEEFSDADFQSGSNLILNPCDFDYLLTKGNNNAPIDRSSILLKFDPLLGVPIAPNQPQRQIQILQQILDNNNAACLSPTFEEDEQHNESEAKPNKASTSLVLNSGVAEKVKSKDEQAPVAVAVQEKHLKQQAAKSKKHARMSADLIENDCNKTFENSNSQSDEKQINYKMDDLEKKIKNEVLKTEDIEKKLKEAEQREEALIKRITEKDKTISKMNGVIEAYEKAIAELIAEKEQLIQNYEKQLAEVKTDRDSNYHHLTSLETTFSDLHVKYEKSKEMTLQLKSNEESLLAEKRQNLEYLRLQEQRYDKMKNHAMQQLEIANKKLESLTKEHSIESTKLKALLKKEEISRASINEQLQQKSRENAELMTICDELINGQGS